VSGLDAVLQCVYVCVCVCVLTHDCMNTQGVDFVNAHLKPELV